MHSRNCNRPSTSATWSKHVLGSTWRALDYLCWRDARKEQVMYR